ncbi:hypothetical protein PsYK624_125940 [Phanerochaete sordida]|uniref:Uncharacterized protein n=1 Tax=Phanerochaete sordida TaxID=48140 RepID=A0A9P3GK39_9APHY|nr:hypothetical protein PsYK624_125940 [Phanerochaete sordida]
MAAAAQDFAFYMHTQMTYVVPRARWFFLRRKPTIHILRVAAVECSDGQWLVIKLRLEPGAAAPHWGDTLPRGSFSEADARGRLRDNARYGRALGASSPVAADPIEGLRHVHSMLWKHAALGLSQLAVSETGRS